jgi:protein gp37
MGENSKIEWTRHTFNPWTGCTRVSPGCDHCYAADMAKRNPSTFGSWEPGAPRKRTGPSNWHQPIIWNRRAAEAGERHRVFCASMADVFDNKVPTEWREDLWALIWDTPHIDWLLLTKRPQHIAAMLPPAWMQGTPWPWPNVWLGTTVENHAEAYRRIPHLLAVPAAKRFLSCEPLLGPLRIHNITVRTPDSIYQLDALKGEHYFPGCGSVSSQTFSGRPRIDWVIAGGESGPGARPSHPNWFRSLRDQCADAGVPFFFKQWGEWAPLHPDWPRAKGIVLANDGTTYKLSDLAYPDGARYGEAVRAGHDRALLTMMYRPGKARAGAVLDGREHREAPHA